MHLKLCYFRLPIPSTVRFVLHLHILLLVIPIGLNSPVEKGNVNLTQKRRDQGDFMDPSNLLTNYEETIEELRKLPNSLAKDYELSPQQKKELYRQYKKVQQRPPRKKSSRTSRTIMKPKKLETKKIAKPNTKWRKRLPKKAKLVDDGQMTEYQRDQWKKAREEEKVQNGLERRHISRVPQPAYPVVDGEGPEGLADDQKRDDDEYEDTLSSQREAFEMMLDEHRKHPKRSKEAVGGENYIILTYDHKNRKYAITEIEDEDDRR